MTTEDLLHKCVKKDRAAWNEFTRRYRRIVVNSVKCRLNRLGCPPSGPEVYDIAQEIFLLIWEKNKLSNVKDSRTLEGWLAIVSLNATSSYYRKNLFRSSHLIFPINSGVSDETPGLTLASVLPSHKPNTTKIVESKELGNILKKEISKLGRTEQLAIKFNLYDNKRQKDIAKIMNIPTGTVATLIKRAKTKLRKKLKNMEIIS